MIKSYNQATIHLKQKKCIPTMSRCSGLALFSSSSLTTSMWPSLAAEISAVQQSCTHKQTITPGSVLKSHASGETPVQFLKTATLYLPVDRTRCSWESDAAWIHSTEHTMSESVKNNRRQSTDCCSCLLVQQISVECAACNSRSHINEVIMRGVECKHACVCGLRA